MKAYAITVEGFHENPFAVRACRAETLEEARRAAEEFFYQTMAMSPGTPVADVDNTAELYDESGLNVGSFSAYGRADHLAVWK